MFASETVNLARYLPPVKTCYKNRSSDGQRRAAGVIASSVAAGAVRGPRAKSPLQRIRSGSEVAQIN
jgi:hypothetical protein